MEELATVVVFAAAVAEPLVLLRAESNAGRETGMLFFRSAPTVVAGDGEGPTHDESIVARCFLFDGAGDGTADDGGGLLL